MHNTLNAWIFGLADKKAPEASRMNGKKVYYALTEHEFVPGKTMYVRGEQGEATCRMFFPEGNDWGTGRQDGYWLMDILAYSFGWDKASSVKAMEWAAAVTGKCWRCRLVTRMDEAMPESQKTVLPAGRNGLQLRLPSAIWGFGKKANKMVHFTK